MRNCYKCCHTNGRKRIKNDGDTTIDGCLPGKEIQPFFYSVLYRMLTLSLLKFLQREHVSYSTYNYWKRKSSSVPDHETSAPQSVLAPISLTSPCIASSSSVSGMTLLFPNGVRAHLGAGMEEAASRLINQYACCHVLPE